MLLRLTEARSGTRVCDPQQRWHLTRGNHSRNASSMTLSPTFNRTRGRGGSRENMLSTAVDVYNVEINAALGSELNTCRFHGLRFSTLLNIDRVAPAAGLSCKEWRSNRSASSYD
jgi:hypothetical protein